MHIASPLQVHGNAQLSHKSPPSTPHITAAAS